jgi:hypothetical protein
MNAALKRALNTPHKPQEEMAVGKRQRQDEAKQPRARQRGRKRAT